MTSPLGGARSIQLSYGAEAQDSSGLRARMLRVRPGAMLKSAAARQERGV